MEDGDGFHHVNHTECLPRPGPGPGFPTRASGQRAPGLTPKLPHQHLLGSPRDTHGFSRMSAHTLQQTGRGPRGTFNTCQELPAGADPGHPPHRLTSDRAGLALSSGAQKDETCFRGEKSDGRSYPPKVALLAGPTSMKLPTQALPLCPWLFVKARAQLTAVKQTHSKGCQGKRDPCRSPGKEHKSNA